MKATVRARLLRLAALLLLPGLAISTLLTWRVFVAARAGAETALSETARGLGQLVDREFAQAETLLHTLAATQELQRGDLREFDRLARETAIMGGDIVLVDQSGRELLDTGVPPGVALPATAPGAKPGAAPGSEPGDAEGSGARREAGVDWAAEQIGVPTVQPLAARPPFYQQIGDQQAGDRTAGAKPDANLGAKPGAKLGPGSGLSLQVVLPVGWGGRHAYDLKLVLPASSMQAILMRGALPAGWTAAIVDTAGKLAARSREPERYVGQSAGPTLLAGLARSDEGTRDGRGLDGTSVVLAFSRSATSRWTVAVAAPRVLVAQAGLQSITLLALLGPAAILAGLLGARRVARRIARPVEALAQAARQIGEDGSWTPIPHGLAETDAVARALFAAARNLQERQAALAELNASLTQRVAARTSELAQVNHALDEQRRSLAAILDQMPAGVLVHTAARVLTFSNHEARRLLGRPEAELVLAHWPEVRQAGQLITREQSPTALACRGITTERALLSVTCPSGRAAELEVSASPLRDTDGQVTSAVTILQDVTARLEAEETRRRSQRLEAVGQLTGGVAHEFNNLLMAITGCLELLDKPVASLGDQRAASLLANAARAAGRGSRLTTQLLAFARRQTLQMDPLDLDALVTGMKELLEGTLGRGVQVVVEPGAGDWAAMADASQVELTLLNLAINARDAMPGGGTLTIRTARVHRGPPTRPEDPPAGDYAALHVSDTGHGMSPHVLARAFEPFFTTKDVGRGSGLGLPQVLGVAQQMGGGVTITSSEGTSIEGVGSEGSEGGGSEGGGSEGGGVGDRTGAGTTVSVFLPRALARAPQVGIRAGSPDEANARPALDGARVLVVDDDLDVRVVTGAILEELGGVVIEAESGAEALLALRTRQVDLVLADLTMPNMTGIELAAEVAKLAPDLPVVLMTGYGPDALAQPGPHIRGTLQKPFRAEALAQALTGALGLQAGVDDQK